LLTHDPHALVSPLTIALRSGQQIKALRQFVRNIGAGEVAYPACRQFDPRRHALHMAADVLDYGQIAGPKSDL
jgi:hypothetical protein